MKFGVTGSGIQYTVTQQAQLPRLSRESRHVEQVSQRVAASEGTTPWEERMTRAKRRTAARRAEGEKGENVETVETITPAEAAYLRWLEERAAHIEKIRARIENGTYCVDSSVLAEDMLRAVSQNPKASDKK